MLFDIQFGNFQYLPNDEFGAFGKLLPNEESAIW
jgi:hypothetical protein